MEATLVPVNRSSFRPLRINRRIKMQNVRRRSRPVILSVLSTEKNLSKTKDEESTIYKDNCLERFAINHLANSLQAASGLKCEKRGYDGLVEAARTATQRFSVAEQREAVIQTFATAVPRPILSWIKKLLPHSKFKRELFATFTKISFAWLVGPCQVKEGEIDGRKEKNIVFVPKCRFLEGTNCVGICTNLCKMPSQAFIKEYMGMPLYMVPNYDEMSCEFIFGQEPPPPENDPALAQPCYKQCKAKYRHQATCTSEEP